VVAPDDPRLDALLREAAPAGAPPGFADRVVVATRSRRRVRRTVRIAIAAAAAVALLPVIRLAFVDRSTRPAAEEARRIADAGPKEPGEAEPDDGGSESFAVRLPAAADSAQRVMMGRINGTYVIVARPRDEMADEPDERSSSPVAMAGSVSAEGPGASIAIHFR